jgi:hypothetical protein
MCPASLNTFQMLVLDVVSKWCEVTLLPVLLRLWTELHEGEMRLECVQEGVNYMSHRTCLYLCIK